jgi:hypothetical protein
MDGYDRAAQLSGDLQSRLLGPRFPLADRTEREIRETVCEYVDQLKELGLPPERIIVAVKRLANEAGVRATSRLVATPATLEGADKLLVDMVAWCIERYYGPA